MEEGITFSDDGFIIKADGITLDLNSHIISGSGDGIGVNLTGVDSVNVKNGVIYYFSKDIF